MSTPVAASRGGSQAGRHTLFPNKRVIPVIRVVGVTNPALNESQLISGDDLMRDVSTHHVHIRILGIRVHAYPGDRYCVKASAMFQVPVKKENPAH